MNEQKDFIVENGVLIKYQGRKARVIIPDDVVKIGDGSFRNSRLKTLSMGENVVEIGDNAFYGCRDLEKVEFSNSIFKIGAGAFEECQLLKIDDLPENLEEIGECAFCNCWCVKEIVFPETVVLIGKEAFCGTFFDKYILGDNISEIGEKAFGSQNDLKYKLFAKADSKTGETLNANNIVFGGKDSTKEEFKIVVNEENFSFFDWYNSGFYKNLEAIEFQEGIKEIPQCYINKCVNVKELIFPDSLEFLSCGTIPNEYNSNIQKVHFGKRLKTIASFDKNYYEFEMIPHFSDLAYLKNVEKVTIDSENQFYKIENDMFLSKDGTVLYAYIGKGCNELAIPETVTEIKGHAFYDCHRIEKLIVPGTVKKVEPAFVYSNIGELIFCEGVEEISDSAFLRSHIENIKFPKSIKKIGKHPFIGADGLKILRLYDGIEYKTSIAIYSIILDCSSSAFWFNVNGKFNDLEFIEIYDKNDILLRRYGLITDKEEQSINGLIGSDYWIEQYHEHLFRSIVGMELKKNAHELPENERFAKSPLNFQYITDWRFFKDTVTKNRFICGILPEINNIDDKSKRIFLNYAFENITDIYKMAQKNNFENVINILKNFPFEETKKQFSFEDYSEYDIKEKLDALHMYINSNGGYWPDIDDNAQIIVERYNNIFKDFIKKEN